MKKTVYLNEGYRRYHLSLDGPSLLIRSAETADRRIPVAMISKLIIFGNITLDSDILTFLSENNIPVLLISKGAKREGILLPLNYGMPAQCITFKRFTDEKGIKDFICWARHMRAHIQRMVAKNLYHYDCNISGNDYRKMVSMLMPEDKDQWFDVKKILRVLFLAAIIEELIDSKLDIHCGIIHNKSSFGLVRDYFYILHPETDLQALQFFKSDSIDILIERGVNVQSTLNAKGIQAIVHRFENKQHITKKIIKTITGKLLELLGGDNESKLPCVL